MRRSRLSETELAKPVVAWLDEQHWDVYQEVEFSQSGGVADIVAVRHGIMWIIECKTAYTLSVLEQAAAWAVHLRSVAIPTAVKQRFGRDYRLAELYYRVGVLEVGVDGVYEARPAPVFTKRKDVTGRYLASLTELHKTFAPAGSRGGYHLTPYKRTMLEVRKFVEGHPGCTIKELHVALGDMHYSGPESFRGNLIKALVDFERSWCRVDTGARPFRLFPVDSGRERSGE